MVVFFCGFIFFFKQKTAYEMRISDWSSDVCSSDLNLTIFRTEFDNLQQSAYDPDRRTFFTRNAAKARSQGFEAELQLAPSRNFQLNASMAYLDAKFVDYPGAPRSEEHTSELQSLMRISYAVFCLKKKKQTHTSTSSHIINM